MKVLKIQLSDQEYEDLVIEARQQGRSADDYAAWLLMRRDSTYRGKHTELPSGAPYVEKG